MKAARPFFIALVVILSIVLMAGIYFLYVREMVVLAYAGNAPDWFTTMVNIFYPRFEVEKHRFDLAFFLNKSDQIIIRLILVGTFTGCIYFLKISSDKINVWIKNFWNTTNHVSNGVVLRIIFYTFMLLIFHDIYWDMMSLHQAQLFYKPIFIYEFFNVPYPSETGILVIYLVLIVSCLACIINFKAVLFSIVAIVDFIVIQGYVFSFEKTDHGFATFTYAGMLMPFLLYENHIAHKQEKQSQAGWPLQLILTVVSLCYLFTGLEKILISNFQWLNPQTFKSYLQLHPTPLGMEVANNEFLCFILPASTLLFQLGFILVLFYKKLRWIFLPVGMVFHISTYFLFGIGGFLNPWILVYIFFVDWTKVIKIKPINSTMVNP